MEYIVYMGDLPKGDVSASALHINMLHQVFDSGASEYLLHSYKSSFNGFVAKLTNHGRGSDCIPKWKEETPHNKIMGLHGLSPRRFGPPPSKWKGTCQTSSNFTGNNKIIGAKYYRSDGKLGLTGTARGGLPSARIAVYKICLSDGCSDAISFQDGILTSNAAGNWGPNHATTTNFSPWSLSVATSTIDRKFVTKVKLGNNKVYEGVSINTFEMKGMYPIIYGGDATNTTGGTVFSTRRQVCYALPASSLGLSDGGRVLQYLHSTSKPTAIIEKIVEVEDKMAPFVASFSSRGPNPVTSDILKPDLTAPGVDIVAAWTKASTVTGYDWDTRSPAAIKSALMTTAAPMSVKSNRDQEFAYGAGQIDPIKAAHPGLIYDAGEADYVKFLCGQGYNTKQLLMNFE
ncbi:Cucumisin [Vitis vinifera]|uniref:Cucumisin n=1 Tax=Vitis vinifera TaxID=29760 RepID=A0A438ENT0_VITVI|nr:Cucumisin [Vitis vinifera]